MNHLVMMMVKSFSGEDLGSILLMHWLKKN